MTSGYNHGNLIKSIVLARGKLDNDVAITEPRLSPAANFFIKAKKNRSYKGAGEKTNAEPSLNSACFTPTLVN